ncbi:hypothetical protein EW146_g7283 [Bondarzewia mesenterica]|uniref:ABC transporter domain-containing protein n=1 Tax=Bondarzewia mesenterica TaxID=1095465 RepID=A0A4S4LL71_9AGAM|nr:hypothetical protein EW146_g7283 [Bondarzewia mesenterica]
MAPSQVVLNLNVLPQHKKYTMLLSGLTALADHQLPRCSTIWLHPFMIPAYTAAASAILLLLRALFSFGPLKRFVHGPGNHSESSIDSAADNVQAGIVSEAKQHVKTLGGWTIFTLRLVRLLSVLTLLGLSVASFVLDEDGLFIKDVESLSKHWGKGHKKHRKHRNSSRLSFTRHEWLELTQCVTYLYVSFLALLSVAAGAKRAQLVTTHLVIILLVAFAVYAYRDLWPLLTVSAAPADLRDGPLLWIKVAVLGLAAIVVPLTIPRQCAPFNPKEPVETPNPEQTASLLSLTIYSFLDPTVFLAYQIPHLSFDQLPPLADYDYTRNLVERSFRVASSLGWHSCSSSRLLLRSLVLWVSTDSLSDYLETKGESAVVRPWVWISTLFFGPVIGTIAFQWYLFLATGMLVRTEGIITQLVFEHSLRIRMKAETEGPASKSDGNHGSESSATIAEETPDNTSISGSSNEGSESGSGGETIRSSTVSMKSTGGKGNQKTKVESEDDSKYHKDGTVKADNLVGKINNLVSTDMGNITDGREFLILILYQPVQILLCVIFLYSILGWSAFIALLSMIILFPVPGWISKLIQNAQKEGIKRTDARVQSVTETMNVLRMIKLFGWEPKINERVAEKRDDELRFVKRRQLLNLLNNNLNFIIPAITMIVTYVTYTAIMGEKLSPSTVFSSISVFDILRDQLQMVFYLIPSLTQAKVSLDRVTDFLQKTELLDSYAEEQRGESRTMLADASHFNGDVTGFQDATFTWAKDSFKDGTVTPSRRRFVLNIEEELIFKRGCINLIVGPTGSGKTSLLMALLGEMYFVPSGPGSWYNLPREGGVAYAAQESWVQSETIRDNILFGAPYDEGRYKRVIYQCGLKRDLTLFEAGDKTEARITLARAIYSSAEIILLDDVLAALDVHTARWVVEKCLKGDLIRGRTVLLVTHNVAMASPIADYVVSLGLDGRIVSRGSVSDALAKDKVLSEEVAEEVVFIEKADDEIDPEEPDVEEADQQDAKADGKLTVAEEVQEGHVSWDAMSLYFKSLGGAHVILFWVVFLGGMLLADLSNSIQTWFLGYWAQQYEGRETAEVQISFYLGIYCLLLLFAIIVFSIGSGTYVFGTLRASRSIHRKLIQSVLGTTLRWLDTTPTSRVIARCTQDIRAIDGPVANNLTWVIEITSTMLIKLAAVVVLTPAFLVPGIFVSLLGGWCGQIYMKAQLSVKREMSNAKAPVLGHFGAAISGLTSIRAYGAQAAFRDESYRRIDRYTRAGRTFYNLNRWVCVRINTLGGIFSAALAAWLIYGPGHKDNLPSDTGFSLTMVVGFSGLILWWVRCLNEFEVSGNSLERIQSYVTIEQESKTTKDGVPPAYWPSSGDVRVENLSAHYSPDGPKVLHDLSFHIKSGERVGVVGRTGSGKSSLTLSLLRCIFTEGTVYYDGIPTNSINLDALRMNITIIPQVPELLSGTLRENLDPFSQHDDATLNGALRAAGLFSLQSEDGEGRIALDTKISSGGGNLSVGQRQILALARAIHETDASESLATSAIDYQTDSIIQSSLRHELQRDVTLITVAHRLQTIMDADKIMVLDAGHIVEFDKPSELLKNEKSMLRALVDQSGDREALYAMAEGRAQGEGGSN